MSDFFDAGSSLLGADVERFRWVGSKVPEIIFLYEIRKSYDERRLYSPDELLELADSLDVDIWPLHAWASRGKSIEHQRLLALYVQTDRVLEVKRVKKLLSEIPDTNLSDKEIENLSSDDLDEILKVEVKKAGVARATNEAAYLRQAREERARSNSHKTPEQISYEKSVSQIIDMTFSLNMAMDSEDHGNMKSIIERAEKVITSSANSLQNSSISQNLNDLIFKAKEQLKNAH